MVELAERLSGLVAGNFLATDFQPLKEALIEKPPFLGASLNVGALDIASHGERQVKSLQHIVMRDVEAVNSPFEVSPFAANARLLLGKQRLADLIGVMSLQQLAFLLVEALESDFGLGHFLC